MLCLLISTVFTGHNCYYEVIYHTSHSINDTDTVHYLNEHYKGHITLFMCV